MLLNKSFTVVAALAAGLGCASADVIELKDKAAISGKILAEKSDSVIVDVGYTALVIPRSAVTKISPSGSVGVSKTPAKETLPAIRTENPPPPPSRV